MKTLDSFIVEDPHGPWFPPYKYKVNYNEETNAISITVDNKSSRYLRFYNKFNNEIEINSYEEARNTYSLFKKLLRGTYDEKYTCL